MFVFDCVLGSRWLRFKVIYMHQNPELAALGAKEQAERLFKLAVGRHPEAIALVPMEYL